MVKGVRFSTDSKNYDGSCDMTKACYEVISGFFNKSTLYHKRIGKTQREIDEMLKDKKENIHSFYIKNFIKSKKTGECDIILPIKTSDDCFTAVNGDMNIINTCIENLESTIKNIKERKNEKEIKEDDMFVELDDIWDKTCTADVCYNKKCCYDKKAKLKIKKNVALIRSGGRDCNCILPIESGFWVEKLLELLKNAHPWYDPLTEIPVHRRIATSCKKIDKNNLLTECSNRIK